MNDINILMKDFPDIPVIPNNQPLGYPHVRITWAAGNDFITHSYVTDADGKRQLCEISIQQPHHTGPVPIVQVF
jgi:hypothetical protein